MAAMALGETWTNGGSPEAEAQKTGASGANLNDQQPWKKPDIFMEVDVAGKIIYFYGPWLSWLC